MFKMQFTKPERFGNLAQGAFNNTSKLIRAGSLRRRYEEIEIGGMALTSVEQDKASAAEEDKSVGETGEKGVQSILTLMIAVS